MLCHIDPRNPSKHSILRAAGILSLFATMLIVSSVLFISSADALLEGRYLFFNKWGSEGSDDGNFNGTAGIALDRLGNVYVSDYWNERIQKFTSSGAFIRAWGSLGFEDGNFVGPSGIAIDSSGNVYVADSGNSRIQKFGSDGTFIRSWGQAGSAEGDFLRPVGIAVDPSTNEIYVADLGNDRIQKFTSSGAFIKAWGEHGSDAGKFYGPDGVAVDSSGDVYVGEYYNNRIQKFGSDGTFIGMWGTQGITSGQFFAPYPIAVDSSGDVFVPDSSDRIQKFHIQKFNASIPCPKGTMQIVFGACLITKWGSQGSNNGQFKYPNGVSISPSGTVYVADAGNDRIQVFRWWTTETGGGNTGHTPVVK